MATINTGGARRSAAQTYTPVVPTRQTANNAVPAQVARPIAQQAPSASPEQNISRFLAGNNRMEGGGNPARSPQFGQSFDPRMAGLAGNLGNVLGIVGMLTGAAPAVAMGNILGLGSSVAKEDDAEKNLATFGAMGLSAAGVPSAAISALRAAVTDDVGPLVNAAVNTNPQMGMLNTLAGVLGIGTLGGLVAGTPGSDNAEDSLVAPGFDAMTLNPTRNSGGSQGGNYGDRGPGGSSGESGAAAGGAGPGGPGGY